MKVCCYDFKWIKKNLLGVNKYVCKILNYESG